jgi:uncharacterized protein (TIGR04141 family)
MAADKVNSISVFLINSSDYRNYEDLTVGGLFGPISIEGGELFYRTNVDDSYPEWVRRFFGEEILRKEKDKLKMKTVSAVFFTTIPYKRKQITFAVAFGNGGRFLIKKDYIQRDFGLVTSRHSIDSAKISSIRTTTYDSSIKDKVIRSVVDIKQSEFFLNENTDALTAVSGKVRSEETGELLKNRTIGGKDSVSMIAYVDVNNLKDFLSQVYEQYESNGQNGVIYESNIRQLTKKDEIDQVEALLQKAIDNHRNEDNLYLNLPIDVLGEKDLVIGYAIEGNNYDELPMDILDEYRNIEHLKKTTVTIKEAVERERPLEYKLFDFVYAEMEQNGRCFIIASGVIYSISKGYKERVDNFYKGVKMHSFHHIKPWSGGEEGEFNSGQTSDHLLVMDEKFVFPEKRDKFEVCDLLTDDKHLIHVKIFGVASQPLGHLFNQGMLSAQCLADAEIRPKIQDRISKVQKEDKKGYDFSIDPGFKASDYTVTFLLLCTNKVKYEADGRPRIPFMAKAVFMDNCRVIKNLGYKVRLSMEKAPAE